MSLTFNEKKATQAAGRLLEHGGRRMPAMKLIRLLYLADRAAILRWGRSITTDCFVFLKHGPLLGHVLALVAEGDDPRHEPSFWHSAITRPQDGELGLRAALDPQQLSNGELQLLDEIARLYGAKSSWELADLTRALPEWREPPGGALAFGAQDILAAHEQAQRHVPAAEGEPEEVYLNFSW